MTPPPLAPIIPAPKTDIDQPFDKDIATETNTPITKGSLMGKNPLFIIVASILILIILIGGGVLLSHNLKFKKIEREKEPYPTSIPTVVPSIPLTYNSAYTGSTGFSFTYSDISWTLTEKLMAVEVPGLDGKQVYTQVKLTHNLENYELLINYKPKSSDSDMTLYGGAAGEFVYKGSTDFVNEDLTKYVLNWQNQDIELHYNRGDEFTRGDTKFTMVLRPINSKGYLYGGIIEQADLVLKNFKLSPKPTDEFMGWTTYASVNPAVTVKYPKEFKIEKYYSSLVIYTESPTNQVHYTTITFNEGLFSDKDASSLRSPEKDKDINIGGKTYKSAAYTYGDGSPNANGDMVETLWENHVVQIDSNNYVSFVTQTDIFTPKNGRTTITTDHKDTVDLAYKIMRSAVYN